jgi:chemotaxis protein CheX
VVTAVEDDIREIASSIWETLFTKPLTRGTDGMQLEEQVVTGCVQINGAWTGAVMLQCDADLAAVLAGELFRSESATSEEVRDTIGELTNMLAGNIKALLPEPSQISLPAVAFGADYALSVLGTTELAVVPFRCDEAPLLVSLLHGTAAQQHE